MAASRRLWIGLVAALPLAAACQLVLNLDQYEKVDGGEDAATDGVVGSEAGGPDSALPDAFYKPAAWATERMPNPAFDGGQANFNTVSYGTISDGGTAVAVIDLTDGGPLRTWLKVASTIPFGTEEAAEAYCGAQGAVFGGKWRLPTRIELVGLIDFTRALSIDVLFKLNGINRLWTSSAYRPYTPSKGVQYWTVDFGAGRVVPSEGPPSSQDDYGALCVKDAQ